MQLDITGHHLDLTEPLANHVREKFDKLQQLHTQITHVHVILSVEKLAHRAEATARVTGAELFANADAEDMYSAIDLLTDKMVRQVVKHKEKAVARQNGDQYRSDHH